jgi:AraC-like DNA-binding protein
MSTWSRLVFEEENLAIPGVHSLGQYNYVAARAGLPPHCHAGCVEISLLVKGYQAYQVGGTTYHVKGGEQYISLPDEMHDTGSEPQDKGVLYWLILDVTKDRNRFLFLAPEMARKLTADLRRMPSRHFAGAHDSTATLDRAFRALQQIKTPDECTGVFRKGESLTLVGADDEKPNLVPMEDSFHLLEAANHIVHYILQTIAASRANARSVSPAIKASLDFIAKNDEVWLNVAHVAEKVHLSESYFKILFRHEVGLPPAEYMLRQKVDVTKRLLKEPDCNITELAYRLGFSSSQYFATVFKRFTNQTPSEFMSGQSPKMTPIHNHG